MKSYVKPTMLCEVFTPEEYCSTCGPTGQTIYKFKCTAKAGTIHVTSGPYSGESYGGYSPCGKEHEVIVLDEADLPFYTGFVDRNRDGKEDAGETAVIWLETSKDWWGDVYVSNGHATPLMSITDIETAKS